MRDGRTRLLNPLEVEVCDEVYQASQRVRASDAITSRGENPFAWTTPVRTPNTRKTSIAGLAITWLNVTKCFIGAASFELPHAFSQAGVAGAIVGIVVLACISSFSLQRLARCSDLLPPRSAAADGPCTVYVVGAAACGRWGAAAAWFGLVAMTLGVCGSYFVFIASTTAHLTGMSQNAALLLTLAATTPLSWLRELRFVALTSAFGIVALLLAVGVTTAQASSRQAPAELSSLRMVRWETYPLFLGNAGFLYLISTAVTPIYQASVQQAAAGAAHGDAARSFGRAFDSATAFVTLLNLSFGLYSWRQFGTCPGGEAAAEAECVRGNVLDNLTPGVAATVAVQVLLCLDLLATTVVFLFPLSEALEAAWLRPPETDATEALRPTSSTAAGGRANEHVSSAATRLAGVLSCVPASQALTARRRAYEWRRNSLRAAMVCAIGGVAWAVPSFSLLTGLTGAFGNNILGLVLPPIFYHRLQARRGYWRESHATAWRRAERRAEQAALGATLAFGLAFLVLSTSSFTRAIVRSHREGGEERIR